MYKKGHDRSWGAHITVSIPGSNMKLIPVKENVKSKGRNRTDWLYTVQLAFRGYTWAVGLRYRDLAVLNKKLTELSGVPDARLTLQSGPKFPPKKLIRAKKSRFVEKRRQMLEKWLAAVLANPESLESHELRLHLAIPDDVLAWIDRYIASRKRAAQKGAGRFGLGMWLIDLDYTAGKHCLGNAIADLCPTESPSKAELGTKPVGHGPTTLAGLNDADGVLTGIAAVFYPPYTKLSGGAGPVIFYDDPSIIEPQIGWTEYSEYTKLCAGWVEPGVENLVDQGWAKLKVIQKQAQSATATAGAATEITPHRPVRRCNSMNTNLQQAAINLGRLNYKVFYSAAGLGLGSQGDPAKVPDVVPKAGQGVSVFNLEVSDSMTGEAATKKAAAAVGLGAARTWSLFERVRLGNSLLDRALADNEPVTGATVQRRHNRQLQLKRNPVKEAATLGNKPDSSRAIQGFLGHRTANAGWQQTYCVCEPPEQCGGAPAVACFTDQFCSEHQGRIELDGSLVFTSPPLIPIDLEAPSRYGFAIVRDRFRFKYFFTAATVAERDSWLYALTAHIYVPRQITRCRVPVPPTQRAPEPLVSDRSKQLLARLPQVVPVPPPRSPISGRKWKMLAAHFGRSTGGGNTKLQPNGQAAGLTTARVAPPSRPPPPPSRPPPPSSMATGNAKPGRPPPPSGPLTARQSRTASAGAEYRNRDLAQKRWTLLKAMPKQAPMPPPRRKLPARAKAAIMTPAPPPSVPPSVPPLSQSDCSTSEPGLPASTNPFSIVPPPTVQVDPTRIASTNPFAEHEPTQVTTAKRETLSEYREPSPEEAGPALVTKDGSDEDFY